MKRGRPTKQQEKEIKNKIISLRVTGLSASYIIAKTGYDKKTVYAHLRKFDETSKENISFEKNLSQIVNHALLSFDHRLQKATEFEAYIEKRVEKEDAPKYLLTLKANLSKHILDLLDKRFSYAIQVVADEFEETK